MGVERQMASVSPPRVELGLLYRARRRPPARLGCERRDWWCPRYKRLRRRFLCRDEALVRAGQGGRPALAVTGLGLGLGQGVCALGLLAPGSEYSALLISLPSCGQTGTRRL